MSESRNYENVKGYKMNFATKTLTMTKEFAEKAMMPNSS